MNRILAACALVAALAGFSGSIAGESAKDKSQTHGDHLTVTFGIGQQEAAQSYFVEQRGKACPPGLAKKGNGCQPPGQAKKRYAVGARLPVDVRIQPLPVSLSARIGVPPVGFAYGMVDGDLVKLAVGTMLVVDAISSL